MWLLLLVSLLLILLEKGVLAAFIVSGYIPQLLTVYVVLLALWKARDLQSEITLTQFAVVLFFSGIIYDILSGNYLGITALSNLLGFLVILGIGRIFSGRIGLFSFPLSLIFGSLFYNSIWFIFYTLVGQNFNFRIGEYLLQMGSINLIAGVVLSLVLSKFFDKVIGRNELQIG